MSMFCYQCEQTARETGCTAHGVCGKDPDTAALQDLLVHAIKGIAAYARRARELGAADPEIDRFTVEALFTTLTNTNFDGEALADYVGRAARVRDLARDLYQSACAEAAQVAEQPAGAAAWQPAGGLDQLVRQGEDVTIEKRIERHGETVAGLQEMITYGLKGSAAYAYHADVLDTTDPDLYGRFHALLDYVASEPDDVDELLGKALATGELNLKVMELLDSANTGAYGDPEPTSVRVEPVKGKAIVVSGHDLRDLEALLEQTEGTGINVYTHGEMLPAHGYPELNRHDHLAGNYGSAWQNQRSEFDQFPGAILMTTNCLMKPKDSYKDRIFTTGPVGWPGVTHLEHGGFQPVIDAALAAEGFAEDGPDKKILVGFGHAAVLGLADKVVQAVRDGDVRHFFLIGGCDGAKPGRNYYTELARAVPDDCIILTLACGKYRFNKLEFGEVAGLPRLLDVGQCNDSYSAIRIAQALADAFETDVNGLPLSLVLSWYEQKAVAILLTLLYLGIRDIRLGPTLPAFVTKQVLEVLSERFNIMPVTTPQEDLGAILG